MFHDGEHDGNNKLENTYIMEEFGARLNKIEQKLDAGEKEKV